MGHLAAHVDGELMFLDDIEVLRVRSQPQELSPSVSAVPGMSSTPSIRLDQPLLAARAYRGEADTQLPATIVVTP